MVIRTLLATGILASVLATQPASAGSHLFVSPNGSDSGPGTEQKPRRSLQPAVSKLQPGDTLHLMEGIYQDTCNIGSSGTPEQPITIQGDGKVVFDGSGLGAYEPIFDTGGQSHLVFRNFSVVRARAAVQISPGSSHVLIEGVRSDQCHFCVKMSDASFITIRDCQAESSRNAFRAEGNCHDILCVKIQAFGSRDIYKGFDRNYLNGDGFIFEDKAHNLVFRDIVSSDNWDAGLDIKGNNVRIENVRVSGNKNGLKLWGTNVIVTNALIVRNQSQIQEDGKRVDGNGVNVRRGMTQLLNCTLADNDSCDVKSGPDGGVFLENCIVARNKPGGALSGRFGKFKESRVLWFDTCAASPPSVAQDSWWADPLFEDREQFHLLPTSPAVDRGAPNPSLPEADLDGRSRIAGTAVDLGALESGEKPLK